MPSCPGLRDDGERRRAVVDHEAAGYEDPHVRAVGAREPDLAAELLDDLAADGQTHARPGGAAAVEPLEDAEHQLPVLGGDALAVVADRELDAAVGQATAGHRDGEVEAI